MFYKLSQLCYCGDTYPLLASCDMTCNTNNQICGDYLGHNSISKTGKKINFSVLTRYPKNI
jgi:hypothetical protein